jgi:hypothetical protein
VGEAKRYLGLDVKTPSFSSLTVFAAVEGKIRAMKTVDAKIENRIQEAP